MVYVGFTGAECLLLWLAGMHPFDALCHSFTTLATGGFSTSDASIAAFHSPLMEWIITAFMLMAGMNFVLHYRLLTGRFNEVRRDAELRYFVSLVFVSFVLVSLVLLGAGGKLEISIRHAAFTVVSIVTTTGYVTGDFELWPSFAHLILLLLMVLGGMSGSTRGGVKSLRALLGLRALMVSFEHLVHPRAVRPVKYGGRPVPEEVIAGIWAFFTGYFLIATLATAVMTAWGYDLVTAASAALTAIGNVGPGLGQVGAYDNFAHLPAAVKIVLSLCMLAGRLEVFTLLVLLSPQFWKR
jgi:trk system potassium uptake protein TrkH